MTEAPTRRRIGRRGWRGHRWARAVCLLFAVATIGLIGRALLRDADEGQLRGETLFREIKEQQGISVRALARLHAMREGTEPWPSGDALDDLVAASLRDVEALVARVDAHAHDPLPSASH